MPEELREQKIPVIKKALCMTIGFEVSERDLISKIFSGKKQLCLQGFGDTHGRLLRRSTLLLIHFSVGKRPLWEPYTNKET